MTAPVVTRLLCEINASSDELARAELKAHLACYYARTGELGQAADLTAELRSAYGDGKRPRLSILIMLIEGLRFYFGDLDPRSSDRLSRACLLSGMIRDRELIALTEAWLAHLHFNSGRYSEFGAALVKASDALDLGNLAARCRLAISLADSFLLIGDHPNSRYWYSNAREAAVKYGDHAAIGAITYNRAALQVYALRLANARGIEPMQDVTLVNSEVQSAINYQRVAQLTSLDHFLYLARIGALIALAKFAEAATFAEELIGSVGVPLTAAEQVRLTFDHAYSHYRLGETLPIQRLLDSDDFLKSCLLLEAGDRLIVFSSLSGVEPGVFDPEVISEVAALKDKAEIDHADEEARLGSAIKPFRRVST